MTKKRRATTKCWYCKIPLVKRNGDKYSECPKCGSKVRVYFRLDGEALLETGYDSVLHLWYALVNVNIPTPSGIYRGLSSQTRKGGSEAEALARAIPLLLYKINEVCCGKEDDRRGSEHRSADPVHGSKLPSAPEG